VLPDNTLTLCSLLSLSAIYLKPKNNYKLNEQFTRLKIQELWFVMSRLTLKMTDGVPFYAFLTSLVFLILLEKKKKLSTIVTIGASA